MLSLVSAVGLFNCEPVDIVATRLAQDARQEQDGSEPAVDAAADTGTDGGRDDGGRDFCQERGPTLRVGDNSPNSAFCHALCVCTYYKAKDLTTDAFDSSPGADPTGSTTASIGINDGLDADEPDLSIDIAGSLTVAGADGVTLGPAAELLVEEDLRTSGGIEGAEARVEVRGDATVGGRIELDVLDVVGTLTVPEDSELGNISVLPSELEVVRTESVQVEEPCGCADGDLKGIAAQVAERETDNHNATLDFDLSELENIENSIERTLPCGRFYVAQLNSQEGAALKLSVAGRAALYVQRFSTLGGPFTVELEPGAELDLFFAEGMNVEGDLTLGSKEAASRVRLYVGGESTLQLRGTNFLAGHIYAPRAELVTGEEAPTEVYGSVFVYAINDRGGLTVHYDQNPVESGACPDAASDT